MMLWSWAFTRTAWWFAPSTKDTASWDLYFNNWGSRVSWLEKNLSRGCNWWLSGKKNSILTPRAFGSIWIPSPSASISSYVSYYFIKVAIMFNPRCVSIKICWGNPSDSVRGHLRFHLLIKKVRMKMVHHQCCSGDSLLSFLSPMEAIVALRW